LGRRPAEKNIDFQLGCGRVALVRTDKSRQVHSTLVFKALLVNHKLYFYSIYLVHAKVCFITIPSISYILPGLLAERFGRLLLVYWQSFANKTTTAVQIATRHSRQAPAFRTRPKRNVTTHTTDTLDLLFIAYRANWPTSATVMPFPQNLTETKWHT
jgi:hypothetical protein